MIWRLFGCTRRYFNLPLLVGGMGGIDAATLEAIDRVIENKDEQAEWDDDEMRSALTDVARGESQNSVAEDCEFGQAVLSKRWQDLKEYREELEDEFGSREDLFSDPIEQAAEDFEEFFHDLNDEFDLGIKDLAIRMLREEVVSGQQLPPPMNVGRFLDQANSGLGNTQEINWVVERYANWYQQKQQELSQQQAYDYGGGGGGGVPVEQQSGPGGGMAGAGGVAGVMGSQPGGQDPGQQSQQPHGQPGRGQQSGQPTPQGGRPQQGGRPGAPPQGQADPRMEELEDRIEELTEVVSEAVSSDDDDGETEMVTIQREDGEVTLPADDPRVDELLGTDEDVMDQLQQMAELGLVDMGDDGEPMAEAIQSAIKELGQQQLKAQQQMSQNFQSVMEDLKSMQASDDEDLTLEKVEEMMEQKLTKSETERLREEMDDRFEALMERVEESNNRPVAAGHEDPDFLQTDREMEFREQQLETVNENLRELPTEIASAIRQAVPALKEMQSGDGTLGNPFWSPPGAGRGRPGFQPGQPERQQERGQQERGQQDQQQPRDRQRGRPQQPGAGQEQPQRPDQTDGPVGQDTAGGVTEQDAQEVRDKLGLGDGAADTEAEA